MGFLKSARQTAALSTKGEVDIYSAESGPGRSLEGLFRRKDISGVIIALQISSQPGYIEGAIKAGKHVLAERSGIDVSKPQRVAFYYGWLNMNRQSGSHIDYMI